MKHYTAKLLLIVFCVIFFFGSCKRESSANHENKARLQVLLTDDPGDYDAVNIDVQDIQINVTGDSVSGWQSLNNIARGKYDLLKLVNDNDTMLADVEIPTGRIHQIRLILGSDNVVVVNGTDIKLQTPSAQQSGLKLNIQQDVSAGILYKLLLDFDVAKSIVTAAKNKYILKPVIRSMFGAIGGSVKGWVVPSSTTTAVLAIQGTDTIASTYSDASGGYLIRGLNTGRYDLHFYPTDSLLSDTTRRGINVTTAAVTLVDTMHLRQ